VKERAHALSSTRKYEGEEENELERWKTYGRCREVDKYLYLHTSVLWAQFIDVGTDANQDQCLDIWDV
jgi:hypothetical protein